MTELPRTLQAAYLVAALAGGAIVYTTWTHGLGLNPGALVDLCLLAAIVWLWWDRLAVGERCDAASDTADLALGKILAVENHLSGLEPQSAGRHARPRPSPNPRAAA